jgi:hypothetical protein
LPDGGSFATHPLDRLTGFLPELRRAMDSAAFEP